VLQQLQPPAPPRPRPRIMIPMRRIWERKGEVFTDRFVPKAASGSALTDAERELSRDDSRRASLQKAFALSSAAGDLGEAARLAERWIEKEPLDRRRSRRWPTSKRAAAIATPPSASSARARRAPGRHGVAQASGAARALGGTSGARLSAQHRHRGGQSGEFSWSPTPCAARARPACRKSPTRSWPRTVGSRIGHRAFVAEPAVDDALFERRFAARSQLEQRPRLDLSLLDTTDTASRGSAPAPRSVISAPTPPAARARAWRCAAPPRRIRDRANASAGAAARKASWSSRSPHGAARPLQLRWRS